jgi:hypothetical protein
LDDDRQVNGPSPFAGFSPQVFSKTRFPEKDRQACVVMLPVVIYKGGPTVMSSVYWVSPGLDRSGRFFIPARSIRRQGAPTNSGFGSPP